MNELGGRRSRMSMYDIEHFMRKAAGGVGSQNMEMLSNEIICKGVLFMSQFDPGAIVPGRASWYVRTAEDGTCGGVIPCGAG